MSAETTTHVTLRAPAISCGACVATIQREVAAIDGVETVLASAETRLVQVEFNNSLTNAGAIADVMAKAGYPVQQ